MSSAKTEANNAKNKRDSQGNKIGDKSKASGHADIEKDLEDQFEKSQEHKRLSGKHGHTGLGFKPEEEETQQEAAVIGGLKKANNNNTGPIQNLDDDDDDDEDDEEDEDEDEDKSLDEEDDEEDDLSDEDDEDEDVNEDISDEEDEDDGEVPTDAKKMKLIAGEEEEEGH